MKAMTKALAGTIAAGAMAVTSASPAFARDHGDGIGAGEIIAGAVILGGIAAIAASIDNDRDRGDYRDARYGDRDGRYDHRDGRYRDRYYGGGNARNAIERCVNAVERDARRAGYRFANVTEIRDVDRERHGWEIRGRLVVDGSRGYGNYNSRYNRYDRYDNYGRYDNSYNRDSGSFTCDVSRGRVTGLDYSGIRGLR